MNRSCMVFHRERMNRPADTNYWRAETLFVLFTTVLTTPGAYQTFDESSFKWLNTNFDMPDMCIQVSKLTSWIMYTLASVSLVNDSVRDHPSSAWRQNDGSNEFTKLTVHELAWHHQGHTSLGPGFGHKLSSFYSFSILPHSSNCYTGHQIIWLHLYCFLIFYFCLFRAAYTAYGNSQARGPIGAIAAGLCHTMAMPDLSQICKLPQSLWQCWILNPLSGARDWTHILMDTSQILNLLCHNGTTFLYLFIYDRIIYFDNFF